MKGGESIQDTYLNLKQLQKHLMVAKGLIYKLVKTNQIPHERGSGKINLQKVKEINGYIEGIKRDPTFCWKVGQN